LAQRLYARLHASRDAPRATPSASYGDDDEIDAKNASASNDARACAETWRRRRRRRARRRAPVVVVVAVVVVVERALDIAIARTTRASVSTPLGTRASARTDARCADARASVTSGRSPRHSPSHARASD
jgi:hypothetical protein